MKIPLPAGFFIYIGKGSNKKKYLKNFVFLFENIAEIQFPINYLTSRIKNGNKEFIQQAFTFKYLVGDTFIYALTLPFSTNLWYISEN